MHAMDGTWDSHQRIPQVLGTFTLTRPDMLNDITSLDRFGGSESMRSRLADVDRKGDGGRSDRRLTYQTPPKSTTNRFPPSTLLHLPHRHNFATPRPPPHISPLHSFPPDLPLCLSQSCSRQHGLRPQWLCEVCPRHPESSPPTGTDSVDSQTRDGAHALPRRKRCFPLLELFG